MRKKLDIEAPEEITSLELAMVEQKREQGLNVIEQRRKYELITPLYGGGMTPTEADPITVVRATEIRGQLRFWWRATRGWKSNGDPKAMKIEEDSIWGKAHEKEEKALSNEPLNAAAQKPSVQIFVEKIGDPSEVKVFRVVKNKHGENVSEHNKSSNVPQYAAFSLQHSKKELAQEKQAEKKVRDQVKFRLTISYPSLLSKEIEAALWAWETFGGIGGRTRRGFGALHLLEVENAPYQSLSTPREVEQWIEDKMSEYIEQETFPPDFPHLSRKMKLVVIPSAKNAMQVWSNLIEELKEFRLKKDYNQRSAWPEADTLRKFADKKTKNTPPSPQKFPRAAFGLPIIFHFTGNDAPDDYTLNEVDTQDTNKKRFASPLILRPFLYQGNRAVGLAVLLEGSRVDLNNLVVQDDEKKTPHLVKGTLTDDEARKLTKNIPDLKKETDVLQAFMNTLRGIK